MESVVKVQLPNNDVREVKQGTTLLEIAKLISPSFAKRSVIAQVNEVLQPLNYKIEQDSDVFFFENEDEKSVEAIRYTLGYILGYVLSKEFQGAQVTKISSTDNGFYCDVVLNQSIKQSHLEKLDKKIKKVISNNPEISVKQTGQNYLVNLDEFELELPYPVVINFSKLKHYELQNISAVKSDSNDDIYRVSGLAFATSSELTEYQNFLAEYEQVNHRKLGKELDLFSFSEFAPGMPFYSHNGQTIRLELQTFLRELQFEDDYEEVYTPFIMDETLWRESGHWDHYKENMYFTEVDDKDYALKPMNCPGHMLVYKNNLHSYRDLPIRMAEFGQVHRHELSGSLNGLFRVRTFNQDDAHIYVRKHQIEAEIMNVLSLIHKVYSVFGFEYSIELSTRPDDFMGKIEMWNFAEAALENVLKLNEVPYSINEGDGAFYGPKIDIHIKDALNRSHQCGTVQLDFQMPEKFDLNYVNEEGEKERPVIIHRAIYGSIDRFLGILIEHYRGALPVWLSPQQVMIIPVNDEVHGEYAQMLRKKLKMNKVRSHVDMSDEKMGYKIRNAQIKKIPYTIVIGDKEVEQQSVSVRKFGQEKTNEIQQQDFIDELITNIIERQ